jgi:hypothetical protein
MSFDDIISDDCSVAGTVFPGHSDLMAYTIIACVVIHNFKSIRFQVNNPIFTTSAGGTLPDLN